MVVGTLYKSVNAGEPLRTRVIFPVGLVKKYNLDVELGGPDAHFPSEFPAAAVPSFRFPDGETLTESIPISFFLVDHVSDKGTLYGNGSEADKALILSWMNRWNNDFMNALATQFVMTLGKIPANKAVWDAAEGTVDRASTIINDHLTRHTYLVGETPTLADYYAVPMLLRAVTAVWGEKERAKYPAIMRWFNTVKYDPIFDGFFDKVEFAKEGAVPKF